MEQGEGLLDDPIGHIPYRNGASWMVTKNEAITAAAEFLKRTAYPDRADSVVVLPESAILFDYGWTVCFDFKEHIETGDFTQAPFSAVIVVPHDRSAAHFAPTFPPTEEYMALQATGNWPPRKEDWSGSPVPPVT
ncbi:YrhB domain-containing protein [Streptomyces sp. NPDC054874]